MVCREIIELPNTGDVTRKIVYCSTQLCVIVGFNNYVHCVCNVVFAILSADKSAVPQNGESKEICALIGIVHLLAG